MSAAQEITSSATNRRQSAFLRANDTLIRAYSYFGESDPIQRADPKLNSKTKTSQSLLKIETKEETSGPEWLTVWKRTVDENKLEIFWITIYTIIIAYIFAEKAYSLLTLYLNFSICLIY